MQDGKVDVNRVNSLLNLLVEINRRKISGVENDPLWESVLTWLWLCVIVYDKYIQNKIICFSNNRSYWECLEVK